MHGIENWGVSLILWLQSFSGPALDALFSLITFLGDERFYLLLLPLVFWCWDKRLGTRLAVLVLLSNTANIMAKFAFALPRPSPSVVRYVVSQEGYGFPSGHTQSVTVAFGALAHHRRRWLAYGAAGITVLAVGLSRLYLGVHYPHDVLGGLVFGLLSFALFLWLAPIVERSWKAWSAAARYALVLVAPVALLLLCRLEDAAGSLGALAGFAVGEMIEAESIRFTPTGSPWQRLLRFILGAVFVVGLYFGLKVVPLDGVAWRFARYAAVGLVATAVVPWLFVRLGLAQTEPVAAVQPA